MARLGRPGLSDAQRRELWDRWKAGDSISDIGRALFKHPGSVHEVLALGGGIYRPAPKRAASALTTHEREQISRGLASGQSCRQIAVDICCDGSQAPRKGEAPHVTAREMVFLQEWPSHVFQGKQMLLRNPYCVVEGVRPSNL